MCTSGCFRIWGHLAHPGETAPPRVTNTQREVVTHHKHIFHLPINQHGAPPSTHLPPPLSNAPSKPTFPAPNHHRAKNRTSRPPYRPESTKSIHTSQFTTSSNLPALPHKADSGPLSPLAPSISPGPSDMAPPPGSCGEH